MSVSANSPKPVATGSDGIADIVIVDDDDLFRESIQRNLIDSGYRVRAFESGADVLAFLDGGGKADLMLLDWKMPGLTGIEVLRSLRERDNAIPVIFLTVLSDQIYEEAALLGGAVDFVEKAKSFTILQRRIELTLTETAAPDEKPEDRDIDAGSLQILAGPREVYWRGKKADLTVSEFQIVHLLASSAGEYVDYRKIYDVVHGEGFAAGEGATGYRTNVRAFIKRIRQKFKSLDSDFDHIVNFPGFGYKWETDGGSN